MHLENAPKHKLTLYFIHHGQTDWNIEKRIQGHADIPLNANGLKDVHALKSIIDPIPLTHCFSSDLLRTVQTAQIIVQDRGLVVMKDKRLRERDFGKWQGKPNDLLPKNDESIETDDAISIRISSFLQELLHKYPNGHVLIVTHWGVIKSVLSKILNTSLSSTHFELQPHFLLKISCSNDLWALEELHGVYLNFSGNSL